MRARASAADRGFTLLEVTVALAILAALTAVAGVALAPLRERFRLAADIRELALWLEQARGRALTRAEPVLVRFDAAASRFVAVPVHRPGPVLAAGISVAVDDPDGGTGVTFRPDGGATGAVIRVGAGGRGAWITVDALTGRVRIGDGPGVGDVR